MKFRKYKTLLLADIKSQKGSFIGILVLVFMITISLCAVLSIWENANTYEKDRINGIGFGDVSYWVTGITDDESGSLMNQIRALDEVEAVEVQDILCFTEYAVYGQDTSEPDRVSSISVEGSFFLQEWGDERYDYPVYNQSLTGLEAQPEELQDGEIYVSPAFASLYHAEIGDVVEVGALAGNGGSCYTIKGYFEDSVAGSALMGMKHALMTKEDMRKLREETGTAQTKVFHIFANADESLSDSARAGMLQRVLNEKTDLSQYNGFVYTKSAIMGFMLILQNLFGGLFLLFVLVLLAVAMVIIGHSISSSIELNYEDMGILKAFGYTCADLRTIQLMQYLTAVICGMIPGIPVSAFVVKGINSVTVTVTGLLIPSDIPLLSSLLALGAVLAVIIGFICMKTVKIGRITPIRAIRGGAQDVYFKSRLTAPVYKKALGFWLACRQLVSGKKQYFSICLVSALLVFVLSLMGRMGAWLGPDGKGLMDAFGASPYDLSVEYAEKEARDEVEEAINLRAGIAASYESKLSRASINGVEYLMNVISEPEYYNVVEGRTCLYRNELVLTKMVAEELGVRIGDSVMLLCKGEELPFLISGIYQSANDMGANFGISTEGYETFQSNGEEESYRTHYLLKEQTAAEALMEELREGYQGKISVDINTWSGIDSIVAAASVLMGFMYLVTVVFVLVTVALTSGKILHKEKHDLGIYKSLGFASGSLRTSFALRFFLTAAAGSVFGTALSACLTDPMASAVLEVCGMSHFTSSLSFWGMVLPGSVVCGLFLVFAYLAAGKIRKVEPGILIVE